MARPTVRARLRLRSSELSCGSAPAGASAFSLLVQRKGTKRKDTLSRAPAIAGSRPQRRARGRADTTSCRDGALAAVPGRSTHCARHYVRRSRKGPNVKSTATAQQRGRLAVRRQSRRAVAVGPPSKAPNAASRAGGARQGCRARTVGTRMCRRSARRARRVVRVPASAGVFVGCAFFGLPFFAQAKKGNSPRRGRNQSSGDEHVR